MLDPAFLAQRQQAALIALDRHLETWNSRNATIWATSLHFPHVRPGPGAFEMTRTPEEYAKGINFEQTLKTGWDHSEWVTRSVLQVGWDKVHASGTWQRYTADGKTLAGSDITYIITRQGDHWGVQARFDGWNAHDPDRLAATLHYPHVLVADSMVEIWRTSADYLAGPEPGRQRTWSKTRVDDSAVVQVTATGANITARYSRLGRDGSVLSTDSGVFLAVQRDGAWKIQARSTLGS